jgi:hypothetical protein
MKLTTLERRLKEALPEDYAEDIEKEFDRYRTEVQTVSNEPDKIGQAQLTKSEQRLLPMGNQHTKWNLIRWQVVKAAAIHHGVIDWTSKVDTSLTYEENVQLMKKHGTNNNTTTMREMAHKLK